MFGEHLLVCVHSIGADCRIRRQYNCQQTRLFKGFILTSNQKVRTETLYHRDDALLYVAYVMLIWAAPIPADRWHCSLWP